MVAHTVSDKHTTIPTAKLSITANLLVHHIPYKFKKNKHANYVFQIGTMSNCNIPLVVHMTKSWLTSLIVGARGRYSDPMESPWHYECGQREENTWTWLLSYTNLVLVYLGEQVPHLRVKFLRNSVQSSIQPSPASPLALSVNLIQVHLLRYVCLWAEEPDVLMELSTDILFTRSDYRQLPSGIPILSSCKQEQNSLCYNENTLLK